MISWMTPDTNRLLMYLGIGLISFSVITSLIARKIRNSFKPFSKKAIWYMVVAAALFALTSLLIGVRLFTTYTGYFIFFQVMFLLYGCLHVYQLKTRMDWSRDDK